MPRILVAVFVLGAALIGLGAWLIWPHPTVVQRDVPEVRCDPIIEFSRTIREAAWRNPMDGRPSDFPGGLK